MSSRMLEEARQAAECVARMLQNDEARYEELGARLRARPPAATITLARGSSDHAASYFAYLGAARGGQLITSLSPSLMTLYSAPIATAGLLAVAVSQSGRSPDVRLPMQRLRAAGATTVALINDTWSPLAQCAEWVLPLHAGQEVSVAATKSFICSMVAGARLAAHWNDDRDLMSAVADLPRALAQACDQDWSDALPVLQRAKGLFVIGRGTALSIAQEAALKLKETCRMQAEAFSSAEVKHGPMAVVEEGYPIFVFAPRGPAQADALALAADMRGRGAEVILAAPADVPERQLTLTTTETPDLDPVAAIQSFYILAERLARERGLDPDVPRHLSKVTSTL